MKTSYFAKYKGNNGISIALSTPKWFSGRQYKELNPSWNLLKGYKNDTISQEEYVQVYNEQLSKLDPKQVYQDLHYWVDEEPVLLCYEKSGQFCHRHLVAKWLEENLNIEIKEI